ncbi:MAG: efflux RND transporter periplasmic adaptor subunit [Gammaproteobacteria bacterium]|nr:efflux RND transporter periplasmic adaptor subunit [Gammaproteobacteria bacterium]
MSNQHDTSPPNRRRWPRLLAIVVGLILVLIVARAWLGGADTPENGPPPAAVVETVRAETRVITEAVRGVGTLRASAEIDISPEVGGRITLLAFREGGRVEAGQVLVELRDARLREQLNSREAALAAAVSRARNAERVHARAETLRAQRQISEGDYEQAFTDMQAAQADVRGLEADIAALREQMAEMTLRAPFAGEISEQQVDEGAFVEAGRRIATLYRADPLHMSFSIPERYAGRISLEDEVEITVASFPGERFAAELDVISPSVDERSRTLGLRATIANPEGRLRPGGFATARVIVERRDDLPVLPEEALIGTRDGFIVFVVEDGRAVRREVRTGLRDNGMVSIVEGLAAGEQVVRLGHQRVSDGTRVEVVSDAQSANTR